MNKRLNITFISSEATPFAKTGGMADVCGALPIELEKLGLELILVMPYYKQVAQTKPKPRKTRHSVTVRIAGKEIKGDVYSRKITDHFRAYFIDNPDFFARQELYGTPHGDFPDNAQRFGFFCKAALNLLPALAFQPDIIHVHDWQTALVPFLLKTERRNDTFYSRTKTVLSIHNLAYQGLFDKTVLHGLNISRDWFTPKGMEFYGKVNFLKAGLITADNISTVSKKYSLEMQTPEYGCGLDGVLKEQGGHIQGILNGVDYSEWHPQRDKYIVKDYSLDDMSGKMDCRHNLLQEYNLTAKDDTPIIGIISRLADQKGFDILAKAMPSLAEMDLRILLLGTGENKYHSLFKKMQKKYHEHLGVRLAFNNSLAHKIEAGSDLFLMPSRYEPCGLNQIYSLKYGTIPIVRATGGLDDTIENFNPETGTGNGFKFKEYSSRALIAKVKEALDMYRHKDYWQKLVINAMGQDFSWPNSARKYVKLYQNLLA